jgi:hypothetical protein
MQGLATVEEVRSLTRLKATASTARVLSLSQIAEEHGQTPAYRSHPFFDHSILNRAIIIKHKLRADEPTLFDHHRTSGTKVLLPIDGDDLGIGAQSFFIGQIGYLALIEQSLGMRVDTHPGDFSTLKALDFLPSLDPFLLREHLKAINRTPAPCYFNVSDADLNGVVEFAVSEVANLAEMMCASPALLQKYSLKLARKIILNEDGRDFEPLRQAMRLDPRAFDEGMFCWKAFIYYKWRMSVLEPKLPAVMKDLVARISRLRNGHPLKPMLLDNGRRVSANVGRSLQTVRSILEIYERAYLSMTQTGKTTEFRDFLVKSPNFFQDLGRSISGLDHVATYWTYRFPGGDCASAPGEELADILCDFDQGLSPDRQYTG